MPASRQSVSEMESKTIMQGISRTVVSCLFVWGLTLSHVTTAVEDQADISPPPRSDDIQDAATSKRILLDADKVGAIAADTPATEPALSAALPGLRIEKGEDFTENRAYRVFRAHQGNDLLLTIVPGERQRIHSVIASSPKVRNGLGLPVGSRFDDAYAGENYARCEPGIEEFSGMLLCPSPSAANVIYVFSGAWNGPDGERPPRSQVRDWTLSQISWTPRTAN